MTTSADEILRLLFTYTDAFDRGDMEAVIKLLQYARLYGEGGAVTTSAEVAASFEERGSL